MLKVGPPPDVKELLADISDVLLRRAVLAHDELSLVHEACADLPVQVGSSHDLEFFAPLLRLDAGEGFKQVHGVQFFPGVGWFFRALGNKDLHESSELRKHVQELNLSLYDSLVLSFLHKLDEVTLLAFVFVALVLIQAKHLAHVSVFESVELVGILVGAKDEAVSSLNGLLDLLVSQFMEVSSVMLTRASCRFISEGAVPNLSEVYVLS